MQYNILWVDDRKDEFVELDYPNKLIKYVSEQFFDASLDFCETVDEGKKAIETKKYDVKRISMELKLKGIDREIIENVTKSLDNEPITRIIEMLSTKFTNGFKDEKTKKRFIAKLQRMGYSWSDIKSAFSEYEIDIIVNDEL